MRPHDSDCPLENAISHEPTHYSKSPNLSSLQPKLKKKLNTKHSNTRYLQSQESDSLDKVRDTEWPEQFFPSEHTFSPASSEHLGSYNAGPLA